MHIYKWGEVKSIKLALIDIVFNFMFLRWVTLLLLDIFLSSIFRNPNQMFMRLCKVFSFISVTMSCCYQQHATNNRLWKYLRDVLFTISVHMIQSASSDSSTSHFSYCRRSLSRLAPRVVSNKSDLDWISMRFANDFKLKLFVPAGKIWKSLSIDLHVLA